MLSVVNFHRVLVFLIASPITTFPSAQRLFRGFYITWCQENVHAQFLFNNTLALCSAMKVIVKRLQSCVCWWKLIVTVVRNCNSNRLQNRILQTAAKGLNANHSVAEKVAHCLLDYSKTSSGRPGSRLRFGAYGCAAKLWQWQCSGCALNMIQNRTAAAGWRSLVSASLWSVAGQAGR